MVDKSFRTVVWEIFQLGRKAVAVGSVVLGAGYGGEKIVQKWNEGSGSSSADQAAVDASAAGKKSSPQKASFASGNKYSSSNSVPGGPQRTGAGMTMPSLGNAAMGNRNPQVFGEPLNPGGTQGPEAVVPPADPAAGGQLPQAGQEAAMNGGPQGNPGFRNPAADGISAYPGAPPVAAPALTDQALADAAAPPAGALPTDTSGGGGGPAATTTSSSSDSTTTPSTSTGTGTTQTLTIVQNATLQTFVTSGVVFGTQPSFNIQYSDSQALATSVSAQVALSAFLDSACSTAADGVLGVTANPVSVLSGVATYGGVTYALPANHLEESIYLQAAIPAKSLTGCTTAAVQITQRFNAGYGYVSPLATINGFAGASAGSRKNVPYALDTDTTGRYYAGGMSTNVSGGNELFVARYFPDGTLDASFASAGIFLYQNNSTGPAGLSAANRNDHIYGLKVDTSGNIIATGVTADVAGGSDVFILRLSSSGALDASFGTTGLVVFQSGAAGFAGGAGAGKDDEVSQVNGLAIDSLGRYIIAISSENVAGGRESGLLAVTTAGALDTNFAATGFVLLLHGAAGPTGVATANRAEYPQALQFDTTGNIVAAYAAGTAAARDAVVVRFSYSGVLDTTFNNIGYVTLHSALGTSTPQQLRIDSSGNIIGVEKIASRLALFRLTTAGAADATFATNGLFVFNPSGPSAGGNAVAADLPVDFTIDSSTGDYDVYGSTANSSGIYEVAIWHFLATGALDPAFASVGYQAFQNSGLDLAGYGGAGAGDLVTGHAIFDSLGRVILPVQTVNASHNSDFALIRFLSIGAVDK